MKLRAAGVEGFCDQEEVLEETTGAGADDHRTNTLRWLCGDVPGHVVREEARFTRATAEARVTRELIDLKIPR